MTTLLDNPERVLFSVLLGRCLAAFLGDWYFAILDLNQFLITAGADYNIVLFWRSRESFAGWRGRDVLRFAIANCGVCVIHVGHVLEWFAHTMDANALYFLIEVLGCLVCVLSVNGFVGVARSVDKAKDRPNGLQWVVESSGEWMIGRLGFGGEKEGR